jgi:hypothetical protein
MEGTPGVAELWRKFRDIDIDIDSGRPAWHSVIDHCADIAGVLKLCGERNRSAPPGPIAGGLGRPRSLCQRSASTKLAR